MPKKKPEILKSCLFHHGTKFVVTNRSEDGTYGPGTTGFVSFIKGFDQDFPNVAYVVCSVIRRGKGGKPRLERGEISVPIYDAKNKTLAENMPDEKRKFYVHIAADNDICEVTDMKDIDFLGWAYATSMFVFKLGSRSKHFKPWPKSNSHILNMALHLDDMWGEDPDHAIESFRHAAVRRDFAMRLRTIESTLVKPSLAYMAKVVGLEKAAMAQLLKIHNKKNPITAKTTLTRTMTTVIGRKEKLDKLSKRLNPLKK